MAEHAAPGGDDPWLEIESLDLDAQGVAHRADGKVVFVEGALPFETVRLTVQRSKNNWEQGTVRELQRASAQRVQPGCPHFGLHVGACGGCKMQHLHPAAQVAVKQRALEDSLWHLAKVRAETMLRPTEGVAWGYRYRARLSVRHVQKKRTVLVGFHERKSRYVADMQVCPVMPPHVSALLLPLRGLVGSLEAIDSCPQIEVACGDTATALVLRHLKPLSDTDLEQLRRFAALHPGLQWWLQPAGPDSLHLLDPDAPALAYALPEFDLVMPFRPTDFTQVNPQINRLLVSCALRLLDLRRTDRVIDWFCGLGNFTLPIATVAAQVLGVEGSGQLVQRACENYQANRPATATRPALAQTGFVARDLFQMTPAGLAVDMVADKWLVDPPREGAFALIKALVDLRQSQAAVEPPDPQLRAWVAPQRIVYVSCNPATLARDAGLLVHQGGYRCTRAGVVNMFPHTAHVESIAVFDRWD